MKYRALGKTGVNVSTISLGTHQFSGEWAKEYSPAEVARVLDRARELGINLLDTAECYGNHAVESLIGDAIQKNRDHWLIATKFGHAYLDGSEKKTDAWSAPAVQRQLEDSLKALRTDHIDLYQFHSGTNKDFENEELWTMLNAQVRAGKIRFLGISLSADVLLKDDLAQLHAAPKVGVTVIQVVYNRLQRKAEEAVLPFCEREKLGVLVRVALAKGFLGGKYKPGTVFAKDDTRSGYSQQFNDEQLRLVEEIKAKEVPAGQNMAQWALAWCLKQSAVSSVIAGCKTIAQLEANAGTAEWSE
ncbi:MAG TPA: aldo/keto reductase [Verrucomicrobiae bacterium]|jgi:aryl-alcohol dehydrogenase-like predicted oxidoreductase